LLFVPEASLTHCWHENCSSSHNRDHAGIKCIVDFSRCPKKEKKTSEGYLYDTAALLKKIENITAGGDFYFTSGKKATRKELAAFMYKINFLTARRDRDNKKIARSYFEEN